MTNRPSLLSSTKKTGLSLKETFFISRQEEADARGTNLDGLFGRIYCDRTLLDYLKASSLADEKARLIAMAGSGAVEERAPVGGSVIT